MYQSFRERIIEHESPLTPDVGVSTCLFIFKSFSPFQSCQLKWIRDMKCESGRQKKFRQMKGRNRVSANSTNFDPPPLRTVSELASWMVCHDRYYLGVARSSKWPRCDGPTTAHLEHPRTFLCDESRRRVNDQESESSASKRSRSAPQSKSNTGTSGARTVRGLPSENLSISLLRRPLAYPRRWKTLWMNK